MKKKAAIKMRRISGKDLSVLSILAQHPMISHARKEGAYKILSKDGKLIAKQLGVQTPRNKTKAADAAAELKSWAQSNRRA